MRLNKFLAKNTDLSRRKADDAISDGRVEINGLTAKTGDIVIPTDKVTLDGNLVEHSEDITTIMLNKPVGFVVSKDGQGSRTIYDLLPTKLHNLNPIGRLDKDSSGLLLLTNDGELANQLTHPKYGKQKIYIVELNRRLDKKDLFSLIDGVDIGDKTPSKLGIEPIDDNGPVYKVTLGEGRNRQIRRSFETLGYRVRKLHRTNFGEHQLGRLKAAEFIYIENQKQTA